MRLPFHHNADRRLDVKMTPMIDVVFLLLIFFVCTASFQPLEEFLPTILSMPKTSGAKVEKIEPKIDELEPIIIRGIWQDGAVHWRVGEADCQSVAQVQQVLKALFELQQDLPVYLDVDDPVPVELVVNVTDVCRLVGFTRVGFAAEVR